MKTERYASEILRVLEGRSCLPPTLKHVKQFFSVVVNPDPQVHEINGIEAKADNRLSEGTIVRQWTSFEPDFGCLIRSHALMFVYL